MPKTVNANDFLDTLLKNNDVLKQYLEVHKEKKDEVLDFIKDTDNEVVQAWSDTIHSLKERQIELKGLDLGTFIDTLTRKEALEFAKTGDKQVVISYFKAMQQVAKDSNSYTLSAVFEILDKFTDSAVIKEVGNVMKYVEKLPQAEKQEKTEEIIDFMKNADKEVVKSWAVLVSSVLERQEKIQWVFKNEGEVDAAEFDPNFIPGALTKKEVLEFANKADKQRVLDYLKTLQHAVEAEPFSLLYSEMSELTNTEALKKLEEGKETPESIMKHTNAEQKMPPGAKEVAEEEASQELIEVVEKHMKAAKEKIENMKASDRKSILVADAAVFDFVALVSVLSKDQNITEDERKMLSDFSAQVTSSLVAKATSLGLQVVSKPLSMEFIKHAENYLKDLKEKEEEKLERVIEEYYHKKLVPALSIHLGISEEELDEIIMRNIEEDKKRYLAFASAYKIRSGKREEGNKEEEREVPQAVPSNT